MARHLSTHFLKQLLPIFVFRNMANQASNGQPFGGQFLGGLLYVFSFATADNHFGTLSGQSLCDGETNSETFWF